MTGLPERAYQQRIVEAARWYGWHIYHTYDSRRSQPGFPDLILARPPELLAVEVKAERGRLSRAQADWLRWLDGCGVETWVVRPADWPQLLVRLRTPLVDRLSGRPVTTITDQQHRL